MILYNFIKHFMEKVQNIWKTDFEWSLQKNYVKISLRILWIFRLDIISLEIKKFHFIFSFFIYFHSQNLISKIFFLFNYLFTFSITNNSNQLKIS